MSKDSRRTGDRPATSSAEFDDLCVNDTDALVEVPIIGRRIASIRDMTSDELLAQGWPSRAWMTPKVLILDNGVMLFASCDPEGNGPGMLFGQTSDGLGFRVA